jgi:hypothetical protein
MAGFSIGGLIFSLGCEQPAMSKAKQVILKMLFLVILKDKNDFGYACVKINK